MDGRRATVSGSGPGRRRRSPSERYEAFASPEAERLRSDVLGTGVVNGYTTVAQADEIARELSLSEGDRLLDLGGGRGWPGSRVARDAGCELVVCDLPMSALLGAVESLDGALPAAAVVRGDGRTLPFADGSFDGVCHTDVLC